MPAFRFNGKSVLFIHIPKAGGTSVKTWLTSHGPESLYLKHRIDKIPLVPQHFHGEMLNALFAEGFFDWTFCIVRNPYTRTLSEYNYRITRPGIRRSLSPKPSFETWLRRSEQKFRSDPYLYSNHFRPQHEFPIAGTEVFRLEDGFADLRERLEAITNLDFSIEMPHKNPSKKRVTSISDEAAARIRSLYAEDFSQFGYDPDNWSDL